MEMEFILQYLSKEIKMFLYFQVPISVILSRSEVSELYTMSLKSNDL